MSYEVLPFGGCMSEATIDQIHGIVVHRDARHVVRVKATPGRIVVVVHSIVDGHERRPGAYLDGANFLTFNRKE